MICPLVEESENMEAENVTDYAKRLREELPGDIVIGVLHGQMKAEQKNKIMDQFVKMRSRYLFPQRLSRSGSMCRMRRS